MQTPETKGSYVHFPSSRRYYVFNVLAIIGSAVPGCFLAWWLIALTGIGGIWQALATVLLAMGFAMALFAGITTLERVLHKQK